MESSPVTPVRPVAPYVGGKRNLARRVVQRINAVPHRAYAEPFVGMGGVFLRRDSRPPVEVINDISDDVATLFRVLQRLYPYFIDMLRWRITSRAEFERLTREDPAALLDMERAARFLYLQRLAFGGRVVGQSFGVRPNGSAGFNISRLEPMLSDLHDRLAGVVIERLPWHEFLDRYDCEGTLFYLDPPYVGTEHAYGKAVFNRDEFAALSERLGYLKGRFILSLNDHPDVRRIFAPFDLEEVLVTHTLGGGAKARRVGELLISGGGRA
jgi:DNA adenine methylase